MQPSPPLSTRIATIVARAVAAGRGIELAPDQALALVTDLDLLQDLMTLGTASPNVRDRVLAAFDKGARP